MRAPKKSYERGLRPVHRPRRRRGRTRVPGVLRLGPPRLDDERPRRRAKVAKARTCTRCSMRSSSTSAAVQDDPEGPLQFRVLVSLDWSDYVGRIAIGRVHRGGKSNDRVVHLSRIRLAEGSQPRGIYRFVGLSRERDPQRGRRQPRAASTASRTSRSATPSLAPRTPKRCRSSRSTSRR
jgi:hypothetical protein